MKTYEVKVHDNGNKYWHLNGKLHREDGPAIEFVNGGKFWYLNGLLHREDGPAAVFANGYNYWYLNGVEYTEAEFNAKMHPAKELSVADIENLLGFKVKIVKE